MDSATSVSRATEYGLPLSQVSIVAMVSAFFSRRSASLWINALRFPGARSRHSGDSKAARAAFTAMSTSSDEAAYTEAISDSSLGGGLGVVTLLYGREMVAHTLGLLK